MDYNAYINILKEELVPAMGCTEPIALAYASSKAREVLGNIPDKIIVKCSGNIIKNAMCVTVPNTGGLRGIEAAVLVGTVAGKSEKLLEVIQEVTVKEQEKTRDLLYKNTCKVELLDTIIPLHIIVEATFGNESATVEIREAHTNITKITKNGEIIFENNEDENKYLGVFADRSILNVEDIYKFANTFEIDDLKDLLDTQIEYNLNIAREGLTGDYGVSIGNIILSSNEKTCINAKIKAYTASASEARMSGCDLPVMTNSGSGNQGITSSVPVIIYAKERNLSEEQLYRGLVFANLITIHQKTGIGRLSAFCGAVSASCSSGAAITYLSNGSLEQIKMTITNTLANTSGIVCDGAKASCAAKIASGLDSALMAHYLSMSNRVYDANSGILKQCIEETITAVSRVGRDGMKETDKEILNIMLENS